MEGCGGGDTARPRGVGPLTAFSLLAGRRVLLDSMAFVYLLEQVPRYYSAVSTIFREVKEGSLQAHASSLVFAELLVHPYRSGNPALAAATFATLRSYDNLEWVDPSPAIAREAARLRAAYSLRTPDAVHVATALSVKAD